MLYSPTSRKIYVFGECSLALRLARRVQSYITRARRGQFCVKACSTKAVLRNGVRRARRVLTCVTHVHQVLTFVRRARRVHGIERRITLGHVTIENTLIHELGVLQES